jgi:glycosyltransferase involved in cell wall biosynthesis
MESLKGQPQISCIVCTYNRQDFIGRCLEALPRQSLDPGRFEVIVVDNRSKDGTADLIKGFIQAHPEIQMTYVFEENQGLSHARNRGARVAIADFLTYIDDDAIADPHLLEEVLRVFTMYPSAGCVGGRIELALPEDLPRWYFEPFAGYFSAFDLGVTVITKISEIWQLPYGANFSVAKKVLEEMGGFSVHLGRKGNDFSGGEETDLAYRIAAQGYDQYYNPFAVVTHHIKRDRMTLKHMTRTARSSAKVWVYMERELMRSNMGIEWDLRNMIKDLTKFGFYLGPHPFQKRFQFFLQALHNYEKVKRKYFN